MSPVWGLTPSGESVELLTGYLDTPVQC
jgi:hypothetical protein